MIKINTVNNKNNIGWVDQDGSWKYLNDDDSEVGN